ncbi:hypothetical protein D3C78_1323750 [compost metagenome]
MFDLRQADDPFYLFFAHAGDHAVKRRPVAEFFLARNQVDFGLVALLGRNRRKIGENRAIKRGFHDDVVAVLHGVGTDHCAQLPDELLGMFINVQHPFILHGLIVRVQLAKARLVQADIIGVLAFFKQRVFQEVGLT